MLEYQVQVKKNVKYLDKPTWYDDEIIEFSKYYKNKYNAKKSYERELDKDRYNFEDKLIVSYSIELTEWDEKFNSKTIEHAEIEAKTALKIKI